MLGSPKKFLPLKKDEKHTKNLLSKTNEKEKTPNHTKRDNPNVLAGGPFVRVITVVSTELLAGSGKTA